MERQGFHLDQLRYLEQHAKHEAQTRLISNGQLPLNLPPGFEVGPAQQQPQAVQINNQTLPLPTSNNGVLPTTQSAPNNSVASHSIHDTPGNFIF